MQEKETETTSAEIQLELIKKVIKDWTLSDDGSGVDALIAIMEILDYNPYPQAVTAGDA